MNITKLTRDTTIGLVLLLGGVSAAVSGSQGTSVTHFSDPGAIVGDNFGQSVALSLDGMTALVGAYSASVNGTQTGKAYIFKKVNGIWSASPVASFDDPQPQYSDGFGTSVALSADGGTALIAAPGPPSSTANYAKVYIYTESANGVWPVTPTAVLSNPDANDQDCFGCATVLSALGDIALVGAESAAVGGKTAAGSAYIFGKSNGAWVSTPLAALSDLGPVTDDFFGHSLSISGDGSTILVGTQQLFGTGRAFVYTMANGTWNSTPFQTLTDPSAINGDWFGDSVALSKNGAIALIGADHANNSAGVAYLFAIQGAGSSQTPIAEFTDPDMTAGDKFGSQIALSSDGSTTLIGASQATVDNSPASGKAYIFVQLNGQWITSPATTLIDPGASSSNAALNLYDEFGSSLALSSNGTVALIGAPQTPGLSSSNAPSGGGTGQAYVFQNSTGWNSSGGGGSQKSSNGGVLDWLTLVTLLAMLWCKRQFGN